MLHVILRNQQQFNGGYTDLFIIGSARVAPAGPNYGARTSDFTAASTTQTYTLTALAFGDVVLPDALIEVVTPLSGGSVSAATLALGITGATTQFIGASDVFTTSVAPTNYAPAGSVGAYCTVTGGKNLLATLTTTTANASTLTAGEVWIWAKLSRLKDRITDRFE